MFGDNPLACAVAMAAIDVFEEEDLVEKSKELGDYLLRELKTLDSSHMVDIRGKGPFIGIELDKPARAFCEALMAKGMLCKETHKNIIRLAIPLVITKEELYIVSLN